MEFFSYELMNKMIGDHIVPFSITAYMFLFLFCLIQSLHYATTAF